MRGVAYACVAMLACLVPTGGVNAADRPEVVTDLAIVKVAKARKYTLKLTIGGESFAWTTEIPDSLVGAPGPSPDPTPTPEPPDPSPTPTPDPAPKPDLKGLAKDVHDWGNAVESPGRVAEAKALAGAFDSVASAIGAGGLKTTAEIIKALQRAVRESFPTASQPAWQKEFTGKLQDRVKELWLAGSLKTGEDWQRMFGEVSQGLRAVN